MVDCHDDGQAPLNKILLFDVPIPIPRLKVDNDDEDDWNFLGSLGVLLNTNIKFYTRCLRELRGKNSSVKAMYPFYKQIQASSEENDDYIM